MRSLKLKSPIPRGLNKDERDIFAFIESQASELIASPFVKNRAHLLSVFAEEGIEFTADTESISLQYEKKPSDFQGENSKKKQIMRKLGGIRPPSAPTSPISVKSELHPSRSVLQNLNPKENGDSKAAFPAVALKLPMISVLKPTTPQPTIVTPTLQNQQTLRPKLTRSLPQKTLRLYRLTCRTRNIVNQIDLLLGFTIRLSLITSAALVLLVLGYLLFIKARDLKSESYKNEIHDLQFQILAIKAQQDKLRIFNQLTLEKLPSGLIRAKVRQDTQPWLEWDWPGQTSMSKWMILETKN